MLLGVHAVMATALKMPELALSPGEAEKLAVASVTVAQQYNLSFSPATVAWIQLGLVGISIYLPRGFAIGKRLRTEQSLTSRDNSAVINETQ